VCRLDFAALLLLFAFALERCNLSFGQVRVSNELRKQNIIVSPTGVRSVWLRHRLQTFGLRLAALEKKAAEEGLLLGNHLTKMGVTPHESSKSEF